jgi:hypothetical protein
MPNIDFIVNENIRINNVTDKNSSKSIKNKSCLH